MVLSLFKRKPKFLILIVDDDAFNFVVLTKILKKVNFKITIETATDAETAFEKINALKPNLVLCDFHLLKTTAGQIRSSTGIDLWKRAQKLPDPPPFLILSGIGDAAYRKAVKEIAHPPAFHPKPYQAEALIEAVGTLLSEIEIKLQNQK